MRSTFAVTVFIPGQLRAHCAGAREIAVEASDVRQLLERIERDHPALHRGICDETGAVRRHLNLFVNTTHIRDLDGLDSALVSGDELVIVPAVSGG